MGIPKKIVLHAALNTIIIIVITTNNIMLSLLLLITTLNVNISPLAHDKLLKLISTYYCSPYYQYQYQMLVLVMIAIIIAIK